jgi:ABC-2 type transport system permease protein
MFRTLLKKELREQYRTHKTLILVAIFLVVGMISPLLAKYTPVLLKNIPDMPPGFADLIPEPTTKDAIIQYIKNISQFGVILVVVLNMGCVAGEKERSTMAMLLTKPVHPSWIIITKWLSGMLNILLGVFVAGIGCTIYTAILFGMLDLGGFLALNGLVVVFLVVYLSITILASSLVRTQAMAAVGAFAGVSIILIMGAIPHVKEAAPVQLLNWGSSRLLGNGDSAWLALALSLGLIGLCLTVACLVFSREEI